MVLIREFFLKADSIFFWPYLVSWLAALSAALAWREGLGLGPLLGRLFPREHWLTRTVRTDALMSVVNVALLDRPLDAVQFGTLGAVYAGLRPQLAARLGQPLTAHAPLAVEAGLAALVTVLSHDLATYLAHWLSHRVPLLWRFHSVHHSSTRLTLFTLYRDHPVDHLFRNVLRGLFMGTALAVLHRFLPDQTMGAQLLGVGLGFLLYMPTVHLHHSHVPIRYPRWLGAVFQSPHLHQLHHSAAERHAGRNLGVIFSFWDRLFGTRHDERFRAGELEFGLGAGKNPYGDSLVRLFALPLAPALIISSGRASAEKAGAGSTTSP